MHEDKKFLGYVSAIGTFVLLALIAWKSGIFSSVISELIMFMSGDFKEIANTNISFLTMISCVIAVVVLELPCTIAAGVISNMTLGKSVGHAVTDLLNEMKVDNHFFEFFFMVILEELFARWLFLGLLPKISILSGTFAYYALFLIGNGIWALIHLENYHKESDRNIIRVLPQFVSGIFFTYIYVKFGLLATILVHFASNSVLFATHKVQCIGKATYSLLGYNALCAIISYTLIEKPILDILPWFAETSVFHLQGWEFWDYVKISVFLSSFFSIILDLLMYDQINTENNDSDEEIGIITQIILIPLAILLYYFVYTFIGLFITNISYRVLVSAILFTFFHTSASASAVTRTFWYSLPEAYVSLCILQALGFWAALIWVALETLIEVPRILFKKIED